MRLIDKLTLSVGLVGAASVTVGAALLHPAAGWIVGGTFALTWSYMTARGVAKGG